MPKNKIMPHDVAKYFWGDDLADLNWNRHQKYIIETLLEKRGKKAILRLFKQIKADELKAILPSLKVGKKSRNF